MRDPRFWAVVLSVAWFVCGIGVGYLVSGREPEASTDVRYALDLAERFDLNELRRKTLLQVLEQGELDRAAVRRRHEANTSAAMEPEMRAIDQDVDDVIRNKIIPPRHRAAFDALTKPVVVGASAPASETKTSALPEGPR